MEEEETKETVTVQNEIYSAISQSRVQHLNQLQACHDYYVQPLHFPSDIHITKSHQPQICLILYYALSPILYSVCTHFVHMCVLKMMIEKKAAKQWPMHVTKQKEKRKKELCP